MFEFGLLNGWIFILYILLPNLLYFTTNLKERDIPIDFIRYPKEKVIEYGEHLFRLFVFLFPLFLPIKENYFVIGVSLYFIGIVLYTIVWINIISTPINEPVTKGLFKYSRHPGRITPLIIFVGISIICESWVYFIISILFIVIHMLNGITEERYNVKKFGHLYTDYQSRTPRWIGY
ncbi:MAG: methyltransferase family protein [Candidatus Kariarchaeaceae archaeon]|jgi:protein-S-isoprenylcysteine O-methyltransferase Ste14